MHRSGAGPTPRASSASPPYTPACIPTDAAASSAVSVTEDDKQQLLKHDLTELSNACDENFGEHKFECANAGFTSGRDIIIELLQTRLTATQPGQKPSANNDDMFKMMQVLAKTNAAVLTALRRADYHGKRHGLLRTK